MTTLPTNVPEIVPIVLTQAARMRAAGAITQRTFRTQLRRLAAEELQPRGWTLRLEELADGHPHFLIEHRDGTVCDVL